jgi:trehalose-6-phosphate synthase
MDPFPHTSIEAKLFSKDMNYITVISDVDGAVDAFSKDEAVYVDPRNTDDFSQKIRYAIYMKNSDKKKMIDKNQTTIDRFNFPEIVKDFIKVNLN